MARRTRTFLKEFVVLFGFLNGVWVAVGFNPGAQLLDVLRELLASLFSLAPLETLLALLPLALLVTFLVIIFRKGGWLGLVAVALAFLGGVMVLGAPKTSLLFLAGALAIGYFATR